MDGHHHKQPAFGSELQLERLPLVSEEINHGTLLDTHRRVLPSVQAALSRTASNTTSYHRTLSLSEMKEQMLHNMAHLVAHQL